MLIANKRIILYKKEYKENKEKPKIKKKLKTKKFVEERGKRTYVAAGDARQMKRNDAWNNNQLLFSLFVFFAVLYR